jgi:hypothetical protein
VRAEDRVHDHDDPEQEEGEEAEDEDDGREASPTEGGETSHAKAICATAMSLPRECRNSSTP